MSNNPARGLLVYNTKTQGDVLENNFYYFDGTKWNNLLYRNDKSQLGQAIEDVLIKSQDLKIPLLARIDQLSENFSLTRDLQTIPFDTNILKRDDLITYLNGKYTVEEDGVYGITLQTGIKNYQAGVDIVVGLTDNEQQWIGRATFHSSKPIEEKNVGGAALGTNRAFRVYTTFLKLKRGDMFHAAVHIIQQKRNGVIVEGIQKGASGDGNVTNISIVKY